MESGLHCVRPGECVVVTEIDASEALTARLRDFGLVSGTTVRCCYRSSGGQVTALALRGSVLALRTRDLQKIRVRW